MASVDVNSFTITVNNGGGIEGAAAQAASMLEDGGFKVDTVGNANMQVYDETLVIYKDEELEQQANAVVALLGHGRAVWDSIHYTFDTDVLVVIGSDWESGDEGASSSDGANDEAASDGGAAASSDEAL